MFSRDHLAGNSGIVGASLPFGAVFALAAARLRTGGIGVAFTGDGALNQGMALESYAESAPRDSAVTLLLEAAYNDFSLDVQEEAVEPLAELETDAAIDAIIEIASTHSSRRIRVEAVEQLAESRHPHAEAAIRRLIRRP